MSYTDTKFCEPCDEAYDWAAPECPGCVRRRYDEAQQRRMDALMITIEDWKKVAQEWATENLVTTKKLVEAEVEVATLRAEVERLRAVARAAVAWFDALDTYDAHKINDAEDDLIAAVRALKETP